MQIQLDISNPQKALLFVEFLKNIDWIDKFKIIEEIALIENNGSQELSFFNRFYGSAKTGASIEDIDHQLNELRSGWERTI